MLPTPGAVDPAPQPAPSSSSRAYTRPILTSILSAIVPGLGQITQGRIAAGALWLGSFAALISLAAGLRWSATYAGFLASILLLIIFNCASAGEAFFHTVPSGRRRPPSFLVLLPLLVAFFFGCISWVISFRASGLMSYSVPSTSMQPGIESGDEIVGDLRAYSAHGPDRGDIVTISRAGVVYLRRVIAVPGEVISISGGVVSIDDHPIDEPYVQFTEGPNAYGRDLVATRIPAHSYFVMGDKRDVSLDSRSQDFGFVNQNEITGRVLYIINSRRVGRSIDRQQAAPVPGGPQS
jgi:signal peptidase I